MTTTRAEDLQLLDKFEEFLRQYYDQEIRKLALNYDDQQSLYIDWGDLFQYDPEIADDYLSKPDTVREYAEDALWRYDLPVDVDLTGAHVRVSGLNEEDVYGIGELNAELVQSFVGVRGQISRATRIRPKIKEAAFECQRCGMLTYIPQSDSGFQEPHECQGCERQGPFEINFDQSEFGDRRKIQLQQPPEDAHNETGHTITVYFEDDLATIGGIHELEEQVGEEVVVYGKVQLEQSSGNQNPKPVYDPYLTAEAIEFNGKAEDINPEEYRDAFESLARGDAPYESFKNCMVPELKRVGNWPIAFDLGAAWLFGAPRIDPADGSMHRGDIHMGLFGPPGVGKSLFLNALAELAPDAEYRSATGLASDVGLTAAAVQDDFADGDGWTLKPGILARAGSHAIIDEIDKTGLNLSKINDSLEGRQMATVDKGGITANLKTRVGVMVAGNPDGGRWDDLDHVPVKEQVNMEDSLWSRFDGAVILQDDPDDETDREVGDHMLNQQRADVAKMAENTTVHVSKTVNAAFIDDADEIECPISLEATKAWIMAGREITPVLTDETHEALRAFYVEVRNDLPSGDGFSATARKLDATSRFARAFARVRLSPIVEMQDVEMAIDLSKKLLGQTFNGEYGFDGDQTTEAESQAQKDRRKRVKDLIEELAGEDGAPVDTVIAAATVGVDIRRSRIEGDIETLKQQGEIYEPATDKLRTT